MSWSARSIWLHGQHYRRKPLASWVIAVIVAVIGTTLSVLPNGPASASPIMHVQGSNRDMFYQTFISKAFASSNTAGNTIIVGVTWSGTGTMTCSDSRGNTYTQIASTYYAAWDQTTQICYALNIAAGANTVTASWSAETTARNMTISEYSGIATSSATDGIASNSALATTAANNVTSTSITTTVNNDLIYGFTTDVVFQGGNTISAGTSFTQRGGTYYTKTQGRILATAGSVASTMTYSNTNNYTAFVVAFKPAGAPAIAHVQTTEREGYDDTEFRDTFLQNTTAGNTIVAAVTWNYDSVATFVGCSDSAGNTYTTILNQNDFSSGSRAIAICYATNIVGGATTVYATVSDDSRERGISIHEYQGIDSASPTDGTNYRTAANTSSANATTSNSITTTSNNDLIFGVFVDEGNFLNLGSVGTGFTDRGNANDMNTIDRRQTTAGSIAATWTNNNSTNRYIAGAVAFKAADTSSYINWVQSAGIHNTSGATVSKAFSSNNTAGNTIVASMTFDMSGGGNVFCSDSAGNSYVTVFLFRGANTQDLMVCYATNIASGANTVTANFSGSANFVHLVINEYSGISTTNPVDTWSVKNADSVGTTDGESTDYSTTTSDNDLIFGVLARTNGAGTFTAGTNFNTTYSYGTGDFLTQDRLQTSAGPASSVATVTYTASANYDHGFVAFRPSTSATPLSQSKALSGGLMTYGQLGATTPQWRTYDSANSFSSAAGTVAGTTGRTFITRTSPHKQESVVGYINATGTLQIMCYNGSVWTNEWSVSVGGTGATRPFDIAYENNSGDVMVLYGTTTATTNELAYRTRAGTSTCGTANWSSATNVTSAQTNGTINWVKMAYDKRPGSDLITGIWADSASDLSGQVWSGSAWGNEHTSPLSTTLGGTGTGQGTNTDSIDVEYESSSGDVMIVYGDSTGTNAVNGLYYATCTGGTSSCSWAAGATANAGTGDDATHLDMSSNPFSDEMVVGTIGDAGSDLTIFYWSGTAWTVKANWDTSTATPAAGGKIVTTGWMVQGSNARSIVVYNDNAAVNLTYFVGNGTNFGSANSNTSWDITPDLGTQRWFDMQMDPVQPNRIMMVIADATNYYAKSVTYNSTNVSTIMWEEADRWKTLGGPSQATMGAASFAFWRHPVQASRASLSQTGSIFENDDEDQSSGDAVDENTQQAAGATAISGVKKGERVTARFQLKNTGGAFSNDLSLFYDHNDGYWTKVGRTVAPVTSAGTCADANFTCTGIETTNDIGQYSSIATDSSGRPWVAYYENGGGNLRVANYVGSGGTGCATTAWTCTAVDSTNDVGQGASIAFDLLGNPWVAYREVGGSDLRVAQYVTSGGTGCASSAWTCTNIDTANAVGSYISLGFSASNTAWITYYDTAGDLRVALQVKAGGTGCVAATWTCVALDTSNDVGSYNSLTFDAAGNPWVSFYDATGGNLRVAQYVVSGGSGCASSAWTCTDVDTANDVGQHSSIAFDPSGAAWVSYYDASGLNLRVAKYVASSGSGCASSAWTCTDVDTANDVGQHSSIAFDPSGAAWVSYYDNTGNNNLRLARYVGSSGSGCASSAWTCTTIDSTNDVGKYSSIAFDASGNGWISFYDATGGNIRTANLTRMGELTVSAGRSGSSTNALRESHADMTSVTDSSNRDDADCIGGGTFNNGKWFNDENGGSVTLPDGSSSPQCTEVSFMVDTSPATAGTTYRLMVANADVFNSYRGDQWRGPVSISSFATMSIESSTTSRVSKDAMYDPANCADTNWGCEAIFSALAVQSRSSIAIGADGVPWVALNTTGNKLYIARYVGSGGQSCGNSAWDCTYVASTPAQGSADIAISPSGIPWVRYYDNSRAALSVATYVGSGGRGCTSEQWTCYIVDQGNDYGDEGGRIAFDPSGAAWISYFDNVSDNLRLAHFVGTGGMGCTSNAWTCITVDDPSNIGHMSNIAFDPKGNPWLAHYAPASTELRVVSYVGTGGSNCATPAWNCTIVATGGSDPSIAFDSTGTPWVSFQTPTSDLKVAKYVGSGGSNCSTSAWDCTLIVSSSVEGGGSSIAMDSAGNPWISFYDQTAGEMKVARYVGSGGSCEDSTAWSCTAVDTANNVGSDTTLAFDASGVPWVSYTDITNTTIRVAKMHFSSTQPSYATKMSNSPRSVRTGDARYPLDWGDTARPVSGGCDATTNNTGYCGIAAIDTTYDSVITKAKQTPIYSAAFLTNSNSSFPSYVWNGRSNIAASSKNVVMQVYRFGSTNAWTTLTSDSSTAANTSFTLTGTASAGSASEYWEADGSNYWTYYRVYQVSDSSTAITLKTDKFGSSNLAPNSPSSLAQKTTGDVVISTGNWHNSTSVKFTATATDADGSDTLYLCVEAKAIASTFTNTEDSCGTGVAYSGIGVTTTHTLTLSADTQYHWQARTKDTAGAYSSWVSYGSNSDTLTAATDVGIDTSAPTGGTVYDGTAVGIDAGLNDGSTTSMSANWTGFNTNVSGLGSYDYSIGTSPAATNIKSWTSNSTSTSVTATGLTLRTGVIYYVNVRAIDSAGNTSSVVSSDGQEVAPSLTFMVSSNSLQFANLNLGNSFTDSKTLTGTITTNAYNGYQVNQYASGLMTSGGNTIAMYAGAWASPTSWTGTGFGYTSSDTSVSSSNRFSSGSNYAGVSTGAAEILADSSTYAPTGDAYTFTYKIAGTSTSAAGNYQTTLIITALASF